MADYRPRKIVLAYSGGLDTSVIMRWLIATYRCPVVAFVADVGQGEELGPVVAKARRTGASRTVVADLRREFVRDFVFPAFRAGAIYEGSYLLGTSLARPLIAQAQVAAARAAGADAVAHGATGKGNDQVRFELTYQALAPDLRIIAPWRIWDFQSRSDLVAYARRHGIPVPVTKKKPYSSDRNLLHISFEGGILEDPWAPPPEDMFVLSVSPRRAPNRPTELTLGFAAGDPVRLNGRRLAPEALLAELNRLGGANGVGRVDLVENRFVGMKSRGVYETPGGTIIYAAHRALESITLDREVLRLRDSLAPQYSALIYNGFWFAPEREALQVLMDHLQRDVTGEVRLSLYKGNIAILGRRSPRSLFHPRIATFEADRGIYRQADATGFINLQGLRLRIRRLLGREAAGLQPVGRKKG